ncbi:small hydrophobic protein [avian metapneumovirus]|uniref:Small hydrophobic protein n=1 Tax=avian metapneumovirus TaxID=38525 RepID=E2RWM5_9MONO|nr:small hydrophobic protein [Avian metapneumovirus]BAJ23932.1 small hydrophobic protein [Avian metapneumovirus]
MTSTVNLGSSTSSRWTIAKSQCMLCLRTMMNCAVVICAVLVLIFLVATIGLSVKLAVTIKERNTCQLRLSELSTTTAPILRSTNQPYLGGSTSTPKLTTVTSITDLTHQCPQRKELCNGTITYINSDGCLDEKEGESIDCIELVARCVETLCDPNPNYNHCMCTKNSTGLWCCYN